MIEEVPMLIEEIIKIISENPDILNLPVRNDNSLWRKLADFYFGVSDHSKRITVCIFF